MATIKKRDVKAGPILLTRVKLASEEKNFTLAFEKKKGKSSSEQLVHHVWEESGFTPKEPHL